MCYKCEIIIIVFNMLIFILVRYISILNIMLYILKCVFSVTTLFSNRVYLLHIIEMRNNSNFYTDIDYAIR